MAQQVSFRINTITGTSTEVLGTSYNTTDVIALDMAAAQAYQPSALQFANVIDVLRFKVAVQSGSPTKLTMKVCLDAAGDECILTSTEATLEAGVTTAATMCCSFSVGAALAQTLGNATLHVFAKLDAGTATYSQVTATWRD